MITSTMDNENDFYLPSPTDDLTDEEFITYCDAHSDMPRCGMTPAQTHRLLMIAGMHGSAEQYLYMPPTVLKHVSKAIKGIITDIYARRRGDGNSGGTG